MSATETRLRALIAEFVDEAVNGDHFCGGVPSEWTERLIEALAESNLAQTDEIISRARRRRERGDYPEWMAPWIDGWADQSLSTEPGDHPSAQLRARLDAGDTSRGF